MRTYRSQNDYTHQGAVLQDDFLSGILATGQIGALGWQFSGAAPTAVAATQGHPGVIRMDTTAASGTLRAIALCCADGTGVIQVDDLFDLTFVLKLNFADGTDPQIRVGLNGSAAGDPAANGIYFEKLAADTTWFGVCRFGGVQTRGAMATATTNYITLRVRRYDGSNIRFTTNGANLTNISSNVPTGLALEPFFQIKNATANSRTVDIDYFDGLIAFPTTFRT